MRNREMKKMKKNISKLEEKKSGKEALKNKK